MFIPIKLAFTSFPRHKTAQELYIMCCNVFKICFQANKQDEGW